MPAEAQYLLAAVRLAVARRVSETSQRATAREIGMSLSGLQSFLAGATPYAPIRKRMTAWYAEYSGHSKRIREEVVGVADVEMAISMLGLHLRSDGRAEARARTFRKLVAKLAAEGNVPVDGRYGGSS